MVVGRLPLRGKSRAASRSDALLDGLKVLAADDDPVIIALLTRMLPKLGVASVVGAGSASRAVEEINVAASGFDCIITDIYMEGGTGLQLLHAIRRPGRSVYARPDMCVVLMSGKADPTLGAIARELDVPTASSPSRSRSKCSAT